METLRLDHDLAEAISMGKAKTIWQMANRNDLSVNDEVVLVDMGNPTDESTWRQLGTVQVNEVIEKRLGNVTEADIKENAYYQSAGDALTALRLVHGPGITLQTPIRIARISYSPFVDTHQHAALVRSRKAREVKVYADGGSRGNPGPSAGGYVILGEGNVQLVYRGVYLGITTNNQAEYTALKLALENASILGAEEVEVYMDSMLVVNQMKGIFKVKNRELWPIHQAAVELTKQFKRITFTHIPRELNRLADAAVNEALDRQLDVSPGAKPQA